MLAIPLWVAITLLYLLLSFFLHSRARVVWNGLLGYGFWAALAVHLYYVQSWWMWVAIFMVLIQVNGDWFKVESKARRR